MSEINRKRQIPSNLNVKKDDLAKMRLEREKEDLQNEKADLQEIKKREKEIIKLFENVRKKRGQPTKATEEVIQHLELLGSLGLAQTAMAKAVGIAPKTLIEWMSKNAELSRRVSIAREEGKIGLLTKIYMGKRNWQSIAWLLERMYREEFALDSKQPKNEVIGHTGKIIFEIVYENGKKDSN